MIHQLNWVTGLASKVELAKAHSGWFLTEGRQCAARDLRVVVMTMNRAQSLSRLLQSLHASEAPMMDVHVSVDTVLHGETDTATWVLVRSMQAAWTKGFFTLKLWDRNVGIFGNWVDAWEAERFDPNLYKAVVLMEDDLEVSPWFGRWFIGAHERYHDSRVGAVTGMRAQLVARGDGVFKAPDDVKAFAYRLMGTWSFSPTHETWVKFRSWVKETRADPNYKPYVDGIIPTAWYQVSTPLILLLDCIESNIAAGF